MTMNKTVSSLDFFYTEISSSIPSLGNKREAFSVEVNRNAPSVSKQDRLLFPTLTLSDENPTILVLGTYLLSKWFKMSFFQVNCCRIGNDGHTQILFLSALQLLLLITEISNDVIID